MAEDLSEIFINNYNKFIDQLKIFFTSEDIHIILDKNYYEKDDIKINKGLLFSKIINETNFTIFLNSKIKIFSHKENNTLIISESLFTKDLSIKNLLNNQTDDIKNIIWKHLHTIWLSGEYLSDTPNKDYIELMKTKLFGLDKNDAKQKLQELLNIEMNDETTEMIDDIMNSFEEILHNSGNNLMKNILGISQKISVKYAHKIKEGNIEIDKLMKSIMSKIPGMEKLFSNMEGFMKVSNKKKEKIIIDENFSTLNVELGHIEPDNKSLKLGSVLKIADNMGIIPGGSTSSDCANNLMTSLMSGELPDMNKIMSNMPDMDNLMNKLMSNDENNPLNFNKIMNIMQKLETINTAEEAEGLKSEMENILQNQLGLDISNITNNF